MENFTPYSAMAGGLLIGFSAASLLLFNGRRAGISGIVGGLLSPWCIDAGWRLCFLVGLMLGPLILTRMGWLTVNVHVNSSFAVMAISGLLVGYGSSLGSGCTSGHGVCGLASWSPRSLAATMTFMASAGVTVFIVRHLIDAGS